MNTSHYPSLELCKKLSLASFPKTTEKVMVYKQLQESYGSHIEDRNGQHTNGSESRIVCPSVMELLDKIPADIQKGSDDEFDTYDLSIFKLDDNLYCVQYLLSGTADDYIMDYTGTLPDTLLKTYLWLKNNNYLP